MRAEILAVGTEILLGDIIDTNTQYLSKRLADLGIDVYYQKTVGDNEERLIKSLEESFKRSDLVITTGGLGPTNDDITKEVAAKYFGKELVFSEYHWQLIKGYFKQMNKEPSENNKKQAFIPEESIILENNNGTAPGTIISKDNKTIIILPGPPKEMKLMFEESVIGYLEKYSQNNIISKTLKICGIGESSVENKVIDIINRQTNPTIAPYAKEHEAILRITAKANNKEEGYKLIESVELEIRNILGDYIYGVDEDTLEEVVAKLLVKNKMTIAVAESCTGGLVSSNLINYSGISEVFMEGCVTYSNEAKINRLGVNKETLNTFGAVSEEVAKEMAEGIAKTSNARIGLSTTGIAGPGGGSTDKPVGLVYTGIYIDGKVYVKKYNFSGNRDQVRERATKNILNDLRVKLINY